MGCLCNLSECGGEPYGTCHICWWGLLRVIGQEPGLAAKYHLAGWWTLLRPVLGYLRQSAQKLNTQKQVSWKQKTSAGHTLNFWKKTMIRPQQLSTPFAQHCPQINDNLCPWGIGFECKLCLGYDLLWIKNPSRHFSPRSFFVMTTSPVH